MSAPTWWQKRPISGEKYHSARERGPSTNRGGDPETSVRPPVPNSSPSTPAPELSGATWSTRGAWRPSGGGEPWGGGGGGEAASGPGSPSPVRPPARPRGQVPVPLRVSGRRRFKKKKMSHTRPPPTSGPHEGARRGPGRPGRNGSGRSPPRGSRWRTVGRGRVRKSRVRRPTGTHVGPLKGRVRPPRPPRASRARSVHVPGHPGQGDLKTFSQATGAHEGPHAGPCLSLRVTPRGPGQRSKG